MVLVSSRFAFCLSKTFPDDRTCRHLDMQYMLGPALIVAPVFASNGEVSYYLPEGEWRHLLTGRVVQGAGWHTETHGYRSLPLWVVLSVGRFLAMCQRTFLRVITEPEGPAHVAVKNRVPGRFRQSLMPCLVRRSRRPSS
jgi:hypothetical protein